VILRPRVRRAVAALLATGLSLAGVVLTAAPASAAAPTVEWVATNVGPRTPMWVVDLVFHLSGPTDCTTLPVLSYLIKFRDASGSLQTSSSGDTTACPLGQSTRDVTIHWNVLNANGTSNIRPSYASGTPAVPYLASAGVSYILVQAAVNQDGASRVEPGNRPYVKNADPNINPMDVTKGSAELPPRPIWFGLGDGYTSALVQETDAQVDPTCAIASTVATACYRPNDPRRSWIGEAVTRVNDDHPERNAEWELFGLDLARNDDPVASLDSADPTSQSGQLTSMLAARKISRPGNPYGDLTSWDWIGFSAGLVDVGIPAAMQAYAKTSYPYGSSTVRAWDVTSLDGAECPDLDGSTSGSTIDPNSSYGKALAAAANPALIRTHLTNMVDAAKLLNPSAHVVQLLYPYFTESGNVCASDNTISVGNRVVSQALRTATDITGGTRGVVPLDLQTIFGNAPTGVRPQRLDDTRLWLTRPYGYPYMSRTGMFDVASAARTIFNTAVDDTFGPKITGTVAPSSVTNGGQVWKGPLTINWTAEDPSGIDPSCGVFPTSTVVSGDGPLTFVSPSGACDLKGNTSPPGSLSINIDSSPPVVSVKLDSGPNGNGWFNGPVGAIWEVYDVGSGALPSTLPGYPATPGMLLTTTEGAGQSVAPSTDICDLIGFCVRTPPSPSFSIDTTLPTIVGAVVDAAGNPVAPPAGANGWFNKTSPKDLKVRWNVGDALSGVDLFSSDTSVADSDVPVADGQWTLGGLDLAGDPTRSVSDKAGNVAYPDAVVVNVDRTSPTVTLRASNDGGKTWSSKIDNGSGLALRGDITFDCQVVDTGSGVTAPCSPAPTNTGGGWALTVTDVAGNPTSLSFTITGSTSVIAPTVTGVPSQQPLGPNGWFNGSNVGPIGARWTATTSSPATLGWTTAYDSFLQTLLGPVPFSTTSADGRYTLLSPADCYTQFSLVCAKQGAAKLYLNIDRTPPTIDPLVGIGEGQVFAKAAGPAKPTRCSATDALSGAALGTTTCTVLDVTSIPVTDPFSPSGTIFTAHLEAKDPAGNKAQKSVTWTVLSAVLSTSGRTTGGASLKGTSAQGTVSADFTLRCNGSPNKMNVSWNGGSFDMSSVSSILCYDDARYDHAQPVAPHDVMAVTGHGLLCRNGSFVGHESYDDDDHWGDAGEDASRSSWARFDSRKSSSKKSSSKSDGASSKYYTAAASSSSSKSRDSDGNECGNNTTHSQSLDCVEATISFVLIDNGESGSGRDRMKIVITEVGKTTPALEISGSIITGNVQAHEAQGNGTNNNGNVNGPTGNTSNKK
jgi:hypothetical protein